MNLPEDCARAASVAGGPFKFTLTSPYMLSRTLLDEHYHDFAKLTLASADALAAQRVMARTQAMTDRFTLSPFEFFVLHTRTRFPFRYGIASMTDVPQLFVRTTVAVAGKSSFGLSAEGLPPKWFAKNPATTFEQDLPGMLEVISHATKLAEQIARAPVSFFDLS